MSLISHLDEEQTVLTTLTLSDMPHCTINSKLAEKARQSILHDRDDSQGRLRRRSSRSMNLSGQLDSLSSGRRCLFSHRVWPDCQLSEHDRLLLDANKYSWPVQSGREEGQKAPENRRRARPQRDLLPV